MTLPDPQHTEKLEKGLGTKASFVPTHHPYASPCSKDDASNNQSRLLREPAAHKGSIVASSESLQIPRCGSQGPTTGGEAE